MADAFDSAAHAMRIQPAAGGSRDVIVGEIARAGIELLRMSWEEAWHILDQSPYDAATVQRLGDDLQALFTRWIDLLTAVQQDCQGLPAEYEPVPNASKLAPAIREAQRLLAAVQSEWPWPGGKWPPVDRDMVRRSREQIERGELLDVEELIRDAQGQGHSPR